MDVAIDRTNKAINLAGDGVDVAEVLRDVDLRRKWEAAFDYVKLLQEAFISHSSDLSREIKANKESEAGWASQRQTSAKHNLERYKVGRAPLSC